MKLENATASRVAAATEEQQQDDPNTAIVSATASTAIARKSATGISAQAEK